MIDVLVPVLGRPQNAASLVKSFREAAGAWAGLHFLCSPGDDEQIDACRATGENVIVVAWAPGRRSDYPRKMNRGFAATSSEFALLGADDIEFRYGWWQEALRVAEETGACIVGTNDLANPQVKRGNSSTHPLVRRSYVEEQGGSLDGPGILLHEGYDHNWVEVELNQLAQARDCWAFAKDALVVHRHPLWRTASDDDTYRKGRANEREDRRLFIERSRSWQGDRSRTRRRSYRSRA